MAFQAGYEYFMGRSMLKPNTPSIKWFWHGRFDSLYACFFSWVPYGQVNLSDSKWLILFTLVFLGCAPGYSPSFPPSTRGTGTERAETWTFLRNGSDCDGSTQEQ